MFYPGLEGASFAPFLRIGLRDGELRKRLRRPRRLRGAGLDVNIPLAVDAGPQEVLEAARKLPRWVMSVRIFMSSGISS